MIPLEGRGVAAMWARSGHAIAAAAAPPPPPLRLAAPVAAAVSAHRPRRRGSAPGSLELSDSYAAGMCIAAAAAGGGGGGLRPQRSVGIGAVARAMAAAPGPAPLRSQRSVGGVAPLPPTGLRMQRSVGGLPFMAAAAAVATSAAAPGAVAAALQPASSSGVAAPLRPQCSSAAPPTLHLPALAPTVAGRRGGRSAAGPMAAAAFSTSTSTGTGASLDDDDDAASSSSGTASATAAAAADDDEQPIVVAAGWLGARRRPFGKYKELWRALGYTRVLAARPPMATIAVPIAGQLLAASFTRRLVGKARAHPRAPILVHLFSGGGFIFMGWVFKLLQELGTPEAEDVLRRVAGVVLDSSPAAVTADVSTRALVAAALGRAADNIERDLPWLVKPAAAVVDGYLRLPFVRGALAGSEATWAACAPPCPKLFLYSDADALIDPGVVEGFMRAQRAAGVDTYSFKWHDSAHVDHYRKHPADYEAQLRAFAARVLPPGAVAAAAAAAEAAAAAAAAAADAEAAGAAAEGSSGSTSSSSAASEQGGVIAKIVLTGGGGGGGKPGGGCGQAGGSNSSGSGMPAAGKKGGNGGGGGGGELAAALVRRPKVSATVFA